MSCPMCGCKETAIYEKTYSKKDLEYFLKCNQCGYQWVTEAKVSFKKYTHGGGEMW